MNKVKIQLLTRFDRHNGNGTTEHYAPGDIGEFDEPLANSLVYEGMGVAVAEGTAEDRETKVDGPEETKPDSPKARKAKKAE